MAGRGFSSGQMPIIFHVEIQPDHLSFDNPIRGKTLHFELEEVAKVAVSSTAKPVRNPE